MADPPERGSGGREAVSVPEGVAQVLGFAVQSLVGALSFLTIYVAALALGAVMAWLNAVFHAAAWLSGVGDFVERLIVYVDVALFLLFLVLEIAKYGRKLVRQWRDE